MIFLQVHNDIGFNFKNNHGCKKDSWGCKFNPHGAIIKENSIIPYVA